MELTIGILAAMRSELEPFRFQIGIELKETDSLVGDIGVHTRGEDSRQVEIGVTLAPEFQGRGLARRHWRWFWITCLPS